MTRTRLLSAAALVAAALAVGCRTQHLGPDTFVATRAAIAAQRTSEPEVTPTFGAEDARATNAAARKGSGKGAGGGAGGDDAMSIPSVPLLLPTGPGSPASWPGAQGNISLEAK